MNLEELFKQYLLENASIIDDLKSVRELSLPDWYIAAGYVRSIVWDRLHGYEPNGRHNDIDVVYFDRRNTTKEVERQLEQRLIERTGNPKWSVKNQARMHEKNGLPPFQSTEDAIAHWPETVTAIGVRLDDNDTLQIVAPYGLQDLFDMVVRRSPHFQDRVYYSQRVQKKNWKKCWPMLTILD